MPVWKGSAAFQYNPGSGVVTVDLSIPMYRMRPGSAATRFEVWSLDRTSREVLTIGSGAEEVVGTIRLHEDPMELLAMLEAGADGTTLTYYPTGTGGTGYPFQLVEPAGNELAVLRDRSARGAWEYEVTLRLRRVDGGSVAGLFA